jgi:hypothetical protein
MAVIVKISDAYGLIPVHKITVSHFSTLKKAAHSSKMLAPVHQMISNESVGLVMWNLAQL